MDFFRRSDCNSILISYSAEEIEKYKQKDVIEEMMAKLLADHPSVSQVFINERDIYLTHSLQVASQHPVPFLDKSTYNKKICM